VQDGLWSAQRRALTGGLVLTITFVAAEALAVVTVMPLVARSLHGLSLYGFVFSAFMLGTIVGIVAAGRAADQRGPALPYITGIVVFAIGLTIAGLAPSMPVLVAGRALQGLGAGAVPSVAYVAIGRSLPERLRAKMMAIMSTAWVAPGLAGPAVSAEVARLFGWRWVFLGLLPFIALTGPFAIPALVRLGRPKTPAPAGHRLIDGIGVAAAAGLVLGGLTLAADAGGTSGSAATATGPVKLASAQAMSAVGHAGGAARHAGVISARLTADVWDARIWPILGGAVLIAAGLAIGLPLLRRLLPPGTLTAKYGLPATILTRSLLTFAFFGSDAFVTLTITILRHRSPVVAGLAVTGSTLAWTAGAWIQARMNTRWESRRLVRIGLSIILIGIAGLAIMLWDGVSVGEGIAAWTVAGFGMGLCYSPISLLMLAAAPAGREGWASASLNLADVLGSAIGIGIGGAAISAAVSLHWPLATGIAVAFALTATAGITALVVTRRLPLRGLPSAPDKTPELNPELTHLAQSAEHHPAEPP
jgi:MFS family permease